jgi:hypothetical protein
MPGTFRPNVALDELRSKHEQFKGQLWNERSLSELVEEFERTYGDLLVSPLELKAPEFGCTTLHRARWLDTKRENIADPVTYSYPRQMDQQVLGRANLPGSPVFYTCGSAESSLNEARKPEEGKELFHSEWRFNDDLPWKVIPMISLQRMAQKGLPFHDRWEEAFRETILKSEVPEDLFLLYYECMMDLFQLEDHTVPAWMADRIMNQKKLADVLLYPSLMTGATTLCHAFKTTPIDAGRIVLHRVTRLSNADPSAAPSAIGIPVNGRIDWRSLDDRLRKSA